jgi:predicted membrane-bound spermidine synthase
MVLQGILGVVLFLSSAGGLILEIVAGRLIAPYVGMSLYTWTAIIAVVLAGLSVGHWIGGRLAGAEVDRRQGVIRLAVALSLAAVTTLLALVALRALAVGLIQSALDPISIVIVLTTTLFLLPSLFVGIVAPIVTKLAVDVAPDRTGPIVGRMYAVGTLGSIFGTLSSGYLFISWIGSAGTVIAVAVLYGVLAIVCAALAGWRETVAAVSSVLVVCGGLGLVGAGQGAFAGQCRVESDYFCIKVDDFSPIVGRPSALMVLDNLVHGINDRDDPSLLYSPYIHFVDEFMRGRFDGGPADEGVAAFFVGGGSYTLPRSWAMTIPNSRLMVAEIDPQVTAVAAEALWLDPAHPSLDIRHEDARSLLQSLAAEPQFDVIFGDAFHDISIPTHLVSREFNQAVADRLNPDGFYVMNVVDGAANPRLVGAITATLSLDFEAVDVWTEEVPGQTAESDAAQADSRRTYVVVAAHARPGNAASLEAVFGIERSWKRVEATRLIAGLDEPPMILTDDFAPVDRLIADVLFSPVAGDDAGS